MTGFLCDTIHDYFHRNLCTLHPWRCSLAQNPTPPLRTGGIERLEAPDDFLGLKSSYRADSYRPSDEEHFHAAIVPAKITSIGLVNLPVFIARRDDAASINALPFRADHLKVEEAIKSQSLEQSMQYDLNQLSDPKRFQRLVNAILTARFGEDVRLTPIQGKDGGSDGETAKANPYFEFRYEDSSEQLTNPLIEAPRPGRYLFQVKYHRTGEHRLSDLRSIVVREFQAALNDEILSRLDRNDVNYFFLVTNLTASKDAFRKVDEIRSDVSQKIQHLHADVWWGERITAALDWAPQLWSAYPELFPGQFPPLVGMATTKHPEGLSLNLKLATAQQYARDSQVKFRQINLEKHLVDLFVDLGIGRVFDIEETSRIPNSILLSRPNRATFFPSVGSFDTSIIHDSVLHLLLDDGHAIPRILIEGGPGQGKSTITQMAVQVYREKILGKHKSASREPGWHRACHLRIPIRIELRDLAHWVSQNADETLEQYIADMISRDSGGANVLVEDIHRLLAHSSAILLLDGLDEIGNDALRDNVLDVALAAIERFEVALKTDVRVVLTTRPPAILGRWNKLKGFIRVVLAPMDAKRIGDYLERWLQAHIRTSMDRDRIKVSFNSRLKDSHVEALARNPMQLSVLLQFINLKGEAFPDRRAELYRDYFQIVIDRDVEKSPELREHREIVEGLHSYLGFLLHGFAEAERGRRALNRTEMISLSGQWLEGEGYSRELAGSFFALGEERFGLIVALSGEGDETTYGFEVQPIQEYFSAAYISNRLPDGKAHEVFEILLYKDYWREVALFLAGLRRPNEKADLVARAKEADNGAKNNRQQNGRIIILELLREGVLSQPRHVQTEALKYAIGFLDGSTLRLQRNPHEVIDSLIQLVEMHGSEEIISTIIKTTSGVFQSDDDGLVSLMHRMARHTLSKEQYIRLVLGYSGSVAEAKGLVRITGPMSVKGLVEELGGNHVYWEGIPAKIIAQHLWSSTAQYGLVPDIHYPPGVHLSLIIQFAAGQSNFGRQPDSPISISGSSVPAIWKLYQNVQLIRSWTADVNDGSAFHKKHMEEEGTKVLLWSNGQEEALPQDVEQCIKALIDHSDQFISSLHSGESSEIGDCFTSYMKTIRDFLQGEGIVSWIAGRCASDLLWSSSLIGIDKGPSGSSEDVLKTLYEIYELSDIEYSQGMYLVERFCFSVPLAVRRKPMAELKPLYEVVADFILGQINLEDRKQFGWLEEIPFPALIFKPLIELCRDEMEAVLRYIGSRHVRIGPLNYSDSRLRVQDTRRILKICRETQENEVLQGAAAVLIQARFARMADSKLVRKILRASPRSLFVVRLFNVRDPVRGIEEDPDLRQLAQEVASDVIDQADANPFRVVNRAAVFLSETEAQQNIPLFEEYPDLKSPRQD